MIEEFQTIVSAAGRRERRATVYLPKGYDGKTRFPVLYMFDGQTAFFDERAPYGDSWRMGEALDKLGTGLIVAAADCDEKERLTEYSPFPFEKGGFRSEGRGAEYLDWLVNEFKPTIDEKYRTLPARESTFLAGSSMGGLMTVFALCRRADVFAGGAALSPSFWVAPEKSEEMIRSAALKGATLYLDYGEKELPGRGAAQGKALSACLAALIERKVELTFRLIKGGAHNEVSWRKQIPAFLSALHLI